MFTQLFFLQNETELWAFWEYFIIAQKKKGNQPLGKKAIYETKNSNIKFILKWTREL